ncbi:MAG: hypothetical protein WCM93_17260 [Bacteroidota bacterium]
MNAFETVRNTMLGLLYYSGALFPLCAALWVGRHAPDRYRRTRRLLIILLAVQAASVLPCAIAFELGQRDAIYWLSLAALVSVVQFLWGIGRLIQEFVHRVRKNQNATNAAPD